jgi:translation initiation factor IF-2
VDVCLVNGKLKVTDTIILPGQEGPIVTQIRGLLTPQPNRDLRVKNNYVMNKVSGWRRSWLSSGLSEVRVLGSNLTVH